MLRPSMPAPSLSPQPAARERAPHRYQIEEQIAHGGMGAVYRALDRTTGEEVALKRVSLTKSSRRALYMSAFQREYQVLASLDHPRIIRVLEYGVDAEGPFYTMELVRGRDLRESAPLPWRDVCRHMRDVATSLSLLHARRLLHRDLSPGNVRIGADGHAKLLDFGALSSFGFTDWLIGTAPLVSPEALRGDLLDQRADLYALGGLAYWALTGEHAFPAERLDDLPMHWEQTPRAPSAYGSDIPKALDQLVLSLLSRDPLARPTSAAEVIARLTVIAQLPREDEGERRRIAQSFLIVPPFVGRDEELSELSGLIKQALNGRGGSIRVEGAAGSGRSRLLEEIGVRAQVDGATVLRADASMHPNHHGTARALALRLLDTLPDLARERGRRYAATLNALGRDVEHRLNVKPSRPPQQGHGEPLTDPGGDLSDWLIDVSQQKPLVVTVDNVEDCDPASLGMLATLALRAPKESLLLVWAERARREQQTPMALSRLREHSQYLPLLHLAPEATLALVRTVFGDTPNVERFAEWLHGRTAGSPLHCVEISRQLIARDVIRHEGGMWLLPASRPHIDLPEALEGALSFRLSNLGPKALGLAQCLSLQRGEPTLSLCALLTSPSEQRSREQEALVLLDELARNDVLHGDQEGYRFSSAALRDALLASMEDPDSERSHYRLGHAFEKLAAQGGERTDALEAGWHFIRGGEPLRGADLVLEVLRDGYAVRTLSANGYPIGPIADAALAIYKRHRRGPYERLPLLAAVAQAGYYEDYGYADRYGDEALDVMEYVSGVRSARSLRRFVGPHLALLVGMLVAVGRFLLAPRNERRYSFAELMQQLFSTVIALVGTATMSLDADRSDRIARVLEPFAVLPRSSTARGVFEFCLGLQQIGREHQPTAFATFEQLSQRFADPKNYRMLPADGRPLFVAAAHFARGAFAVFRADSDLALASVAALEASGLQLYVMIAAQLRYLYHANRGEIAAAARQRELVELHAAQVGSAWQVELWEAAALLPLYISMGDVVALSRIARRFDELVKVAPSLAFYRRLSHAALEVGRDDPLRAERSVADAMRELDRRPARSFIGWTTTLAVVALFHNRQGRFREARDICERALQTVSDDDRSYVNLFLELDIQTAVADLGLGRADQAFARLDGAIARFEPTGHPLALGLLHEARAQLSYHAGKKRDYHHHLRQAEHHFRATGTPALIAKCERLADMQHPTETARHKPVREA